MSPYPHTSNPKNTSKGVFPLYPVERTWTLNSATETKIKRKGFTLLPDYASTAFMIQGATLKAALADCGDILDNCGLSELSTTYVILSRVKTASGLLLLRAFSPELFRMGIPPGPHCLLKFLRNKFSKETVSQDESSHGRCPEMNYSRDAASKEYMMLMRKHDTQKAARKHHGPRWRLVQMGAPS